MHKAFIAFLPLAFTTLMLPGVAHAVTDKECRTYANLTMNQVRLGIKNNCNFKSQKGRWSQSEVFHYKWCMGLQPSDEQFMASEGDERHRQLEACIQAAKGTDEGEGGQTVRVNGNVELYDEPGGDGNVIGELKKNKQVALVRCRDDNWCQVAGGWVWGDFLDR